MEKPKINSMYIIRRFPSSHMKLYREIEFDPRLRYDFNIRLNIISFDNIDNGNFLVIDLNKSHLVSLISGIIYDVSNKYWNRISNNLELMQYSLNPLMGISVVKQVISYLKMNQIEAAMRIATIDGDKMWQYAGLRKFFNDNIVPMKWE